MKTQFLLLRVILLSGVKAVLVLYGHSMVCFIIIIIITILQAFQMISAASERWCWLWFEQP